LLLYADSVYQHDGVAWCTGARGIKNFRWHDLRHTWASWLVQSRTPLYDFREMGGWESAEMVRRYADLAPAQMARHAAVIGDLLKGRLSQLMLQVTTQIRHKERITDQPKNKKRNYDHS
jgi:hypothetical protein